MVEVARKIVQSAVIEYIKKHHKSNYSKIAESIGVHRSHIQKVARGICPLSEKKFNLICQIWNVDVEAIIKGM